MFNNMFKNQIHLGKFKLKHLLYPLGLFFLIKKNSIKSNLILYSKSDNSEESSVISNINTKVNLIEKKLNSILDKESYNLTALDFPFFSSSFNSLLKQVFEEKGVQKLWNSLYNIKTEEGFTINDVIQPGLDCPDHPIGAVACSKSAYVAYDEILVSIAQIFHKRNLRISNYQKDDNKFLSELFSQMEIEDANKEKKFQYETLKRLLKENLYEIQITTIRNLDGYPFSAKISRIQRREISKKVLEFIIKSENSLLGKNGKFVKFHSASDKEMAKEKKNEFFKACGFYRDWPDGRVIYFSQDDLLSIITNEEDHLKFIFKSEGENFKFNKLADYFKLLSDLEEKQHVAFDENLGYLTSLPSNLGSGTYFKIILKVPIDKKDMFINNFKSNSDIQLKQFKVIEDLENESKNNIAFEIINLTSFYNFSNIIKEINDIEGFFESKV